jgi:virginiamycin B lyase
MQNRYRRLIVAIVLLWATGGGAGRALALTFTEFQVPKGSGPIDITTGSDGALWFTDGTGLRVGRITTDGVITEFPRFRAGRTHNTRQRGDQP